VPFSPKNAGQDYLLNICYGPDLGEMGIRKKELGEMIPLAEMSPACDVAVKGLASTMTAQDYTGSNKIGATLIRKIHAAIHKQG